MKRFLFWLVFVMLLAGLGAFGWAFRELGRQGLMPEDYAAYEGASFAFDDKAIPTIDADSWNDIYEAQGFVVASERMFQMDLIRRRAGGRLAEWFGEMAFEHDVGKQSEDRLAIAKRAYENLPAEEKESCESYARGVNQFIEDFPDRWGIEYKILQVEPESWNCADSMLVLLQMSEMLTTSAYREARQGRWRDYLPEDWWDFIYTLDHPWNVPYFGPRVPRFPKLPMTSHFLPMAPITDADTEGAKTAALYERPLPIGSNNWAYRGQKGSFLANDPHLGQNVPGIWYAVRLRRSSAEWVVGASLPGLPGVILGMNAHVSWAFTNTGEDVDDYLKETLSEDGTTYLARRERGENVYEPVIEKTYEIRVAGEEEPRLVTARFTHRGPLSERPFLEGLYSRQWAPLKPGILRLPVHQLGKSQSIEEVFSAIDRMRTPAQNVLIMDRDGRMAYRVSGAGVKRRVSGRWPQDALEGEWLEISPPDERRFMVVTPDDDEHRYLATANERIWIDAFGHSWFGESRKGRIVEFLSARDDYTASDMTKLHNDTQSRFRRDFLTWIVQNAGDVKGSAKTTAEQWASWDGNSRSNPIVFSQSSRAEDLLLTIVFNRLRQHYGKEAPQDLRFNPNMERAWLITLMKMESGFRVFGLDDVELARYLLETVSEDQVEPHQIENKWAAQHPFVANIPVIGSLFRVKAIPQYGSWDLVNAESPNFGPSMRLVWNMSDPAASTWAFPVGQSGHLRSQHYRDLQGFWQEGEPYQVFPNAEGWRF